VELVGYDLVLTAEIGECYVMFVILHAEAVLGEQLEAP
jgi:hypothetical protein